eukprot:gb/GECG01001605.1/.p1 GENE.gb/GECG01001605.1/~~gb/GECG01001605.1/.p1  ORF type:complete len:141 (+),score=10.75 gb/GECG01001605.1/:1-423(+)
MKSLALNSEALNGRISSCQKKTFEISTFLNDLETVWLRPAYCCLRTSVLARSQQMLKADIQQYGSPLLQGLSAHGIPSNQKLRCPLELASAGRIQLLSAIRQYPFLEYLCQVALEGTSTHLSQRHFPVSQGAFQFLVFIL